MSEAVTEDTLYVSTNLLPVVDATPSIGSSSLRFNNMYAAQMWGNFTGSYTRTVVNAATYSILATDTIIAVTYTSTGVCTVTLPLSSAVDTGKFYHIIDESGNCTANNIKINTSGGSTIEGDTSVLMNISYSSISVYKTSDGNWKIF